MKRKFGKTKLCSLKTILGYMIIGYLVFIGFPAFAIAQPQKNSIEETINLPWSKLFYIERCNGKYHMGDSVSQYDGNKNFKYLTFDISNNKVLANLGVQGTLKNISMYRNSYFANAGPKAGSSGGWPGVWAGKDNSSFGPYSFTLGIDGKKIDLDTVGWDFKTGLLDNLFPITHFKAPNDRFTISLVAYAPLSPDGARRIRGLVYGLLLTNNADRTLSGAVYLPRLFAGDRQNYREERTSWALFDPYDFEVSLGDTAISQDSVVFNLAKGQSVWVPAIISMLGDNAVQEINDNTSLNCLKDTRSYFRKMMGNLQTPEDPYLGEFYERQVMGIFGSLGMTEAGKIAGSNWGSFPTTRQIWMKDCFYSSLPFMQLDPLLAQKLIYWFLEFGVRPNGTTQPGGVSHSIGLSVSSILLAAEYYTYSGDKAFFSRDSTLRKTWDTIIQQLITSRQDSSVWLFPSRFISDGPIDADYHTGSNVCAWKAMREYARLLKEVYCDTVSAIYYASVAENVHQAILQKCTVDGPYGKQFIEGTYRDGRKPPMASDGEESDITLMPYYGFLSQDDPVYLNYMKFSLSEHNLIFEPQLHAITWFGVASTAPGYVKGICAGTNRNDLFNEHGYFKEIRKVTDADGSIWWWSYGWAKEEMTGFERSKQVPPYGQLVRGVPGKSGWFSGVYASVFRSRFAGISYDAPAKKLNFSPFSPSTPISWTNVPVGKDRFNLYYTFTEREIKAAVGNLNRELIHTDITVPLDPRWKKYEVSVNGKPVTAFLKIVYMAQPAIRLQTTIEAGAGTDIRIIKK
ncbi:glycoside hydrolase family 125 protein [Flavitalea flava]